MELVQIQTTNYLKTNFIHSAQLIYTMGQKNNANKLLGEYTATVNKINVQTCQKEIDTRAKWSCIERDKQDSQEQNSKARTS